MLLQSDGAKVAGFLAVLALVAVVAAVVPLSRMKQYVSRGNTREGFLGLNNEGVRITCRTTAETADDFGRGCDFIHPDNKFCIGSTCVEPEEWWKIVVAEEKVREKAKKVRNTVEGNNEQTKSDLRDKIDTDMTGVRDNSLSLLEDKESTVKDLHEVARARDKVTAGSSLTQSSSSSTPAILARQGDKISSNDGYMYHTYDDAGQHTITVDRQVRVDMFLVGGGGGTSRNGGSGSSWHGAGGAGGGYVRSYFGVNLDKGNYNLVVGRGGDGNEDGQSSTFRVGSNVYEAEGGKKNSGWNPGDGGSGGGGGTGRDSGGNSDQEGRGGSDGENGNDSSRASGGSGQGVSTREFNQVKNNNGEWETIDPGSSATIYGGGGSGGGVEPDYWESRRSDGTIPGGKGGGGNAVSDSYGIYNDKSSMSREGRKGENGRGGGAGGSNTGRPDSPGGSGIVIVRYKQDTEMAVTGSQEQYQESGRWYYKFTKTGQQSVTVNRDVTVDVFLVGGGGGTSRNGGSGRSWHGAAGAGGGFVRSYFSIDLPRGIHKLTVGRGGEGDEHGKTSRLQIDGGASYSAEGGRKNSGRRGGDGGSGGGGGTGSDSSGNRGMQGRGGSDGEDGRPSSSATGGSGQGFSTREFNQRQRDDGTWETIDPNSNAKLYGGGGTGGGVDRSYWESKGNGEIPGGDGGGGDAVSDSFGSYNDRGEKSSSQRSGENGLGGGAGGSQLGRPDASGGHGIVIIRETEN